MTWAVYHESAVHWDVGEPLTEIPDPFKGHVEPGELAYKPICRVKKTAGKEILALILGLPEAEQKFRKAQRACQDWMEAAEKERGRVLACKSAEAENRALRAEVNHLRVQLGLERKYVEWYGNAATGGCPVSG